MKKICIIAFSGMALLAGCAESKLNIINAIDKPTPEQLTMQIFRSDCSDLKSDEVKNLHSEELLNVISVRRTSKFAPDKSCYVSCYGGSRLTQNERQAQCQQVVNAELLQQENADAQQKAIADEQTKRTEVANRKLYAEIENQGYKEMMFDDFHLDEEHLAIGKKIYIKGYYEVVGESQYLVKAPSIQYPYPQYQIPIYTKNADRNAQKLLLTNVYHCTAGQGVCEITVIGKIAQCEVTSFGNIRNKPCINMDYFLYETTN